MSEPELIQSINYASIIQNGVLPKKRHFDRLFDDHFVLYQPAQIVSGDFYWVSIKKGFIYLIVGDCTGHGVPGAMLSMLVINNINYAIQKNFDNVSDILKEIDKKFLETFDFSDSNAGYYNDWVDLAICKIDKVKKTIEFGGAHKKIYHANKEGLKTYKGNLYPIGGWQIDKKRPYKTETFTYQKGDVLFLGSDGYQDQLSEEKGKTFGSKKLKKILYNSYNSKLESKKNELINELKLWKGNAQQTDDICLVGVRL